MGPRLSRDRHRPYIRTSIPPPPRNSDRPLRHTAAQQNKRGMPPLLSAHNFCISPSEIVYALEKLSTKVQWRQKMKFDPSTRKSNVLCEFHQERGHKIEDCIGLRQEVVRMLNQGHLRELMSVRGRANFARGREQSQGSSKTPSPARTIQMIIDGGDGTAINHVKFTVTHKLKRSITHKRYDDLEDSIIFDKSDTDDLSFPHYDALVITLCIADTDVKRIMVDDGRGACVFQLDFVLLSGHIDEPVTDLCFCRRTLMDQVIGSLLCSSMWSSIHLLMFKLRPVHMRCVSCGAGSLSGSLR
ncbi:PREDICTED: uncharacterized protein LOC109220606 [Nicotiana attenuata]|uniref:uncharacterized protein LOC109220606 n=1 Tax=Nicotiana attenuata TaxID=49451 RepID=UPI00090506E4|nr:PREDICTED: uncharacterized protein LOC109220606 [Nicotiana attenuata]